MSSAEDVNMRVLGSTKITDKVNIVVGVSACKFFKQYCFGGAAELSSVEDVNLRVLGSTKSTEELRK